MGWRTRRRRPKPKPRWELNRSVSALMDSRVASDGTWLPNHGSARVKCSLRPTNIPAHKPAIHRDSIRLRKAADREAAERIDEVSQKPARPPPPKPSATNCTPTGQRLERLVQIKQPGGEKIEPLGAAETPQRDFGSLGYTSCGCQRWEFDSAIRRTLEHIVVVHH